MLVLIKWSKTDPFRNGRTLARSATSICAVMAIKDYVLQCNYHQQAPSSPLRVASGPPELLLLMHYVTSYSNSAYNLDIISRIASILITDAFDKHLRIKINDKNFE